MRNSPSYRAIALLGVLLVLATLLVQPDGGGFLFAVLPPELPDLGLCTCRYPNLAPATPRATSRYLPSALIPRPPPVLPS